MTKCRWNEGATADIKQELTYKYLYLIDKSQYFLWLKCCIQSVIWVFFHIQINFSPVFYTVVSLVSVNQSTRGSNKLWDCSENVNFQGKMPQYMCWCRNFCKIKISCEFWKLFDPLFLNFYSLLNTKLMRYAWITPKQFSFDVTFLHHQGTWPLIYYKLFLI